MSLNPIFFFLWKKQVYSHYSLSHLMEKYSKKNVSLFTSFKDTISSFIKLLFQKLPCSSPTIIKGRQKGFLLNQTILNSVISEQVLASFL